MMPIFSFFRNVFIFYILNRDMFTLHCDYDVFFYQLVKYICITMFFTSLREIIIMNQKDNVCF